MLRLIISIVAICMTAAPALAERVKDLGQFQGVRANQLTGYGVVVGLAGTGDDSLDYSTQGVKGAVARFGLTLPAGLNPSLKNAAAVIVTAELPAFAKPGQQLDITVSALGKAKSLRGGTLLMSPLYGANGQVYAMAQGNLVVGGLGVEAADGSKISINIPSVGRIDGGATVEQQVETGFATSDGLIFNLHQQDVTNAKHIADAINESVGANVARATDGTSILIDSSHGAELRVLLMSKIENLEITPAQPPARVIINSRTGTVVINGAVKIGPVAVSHGTLTVRVDERPAVIHPAPLSQGETVVEQSSEIVVEETRNPAFMIQRSVSLSDIVKAINRIGASPGDLVAILQAIKQAGALQAELVIL
jgi:flagellar P-ring protein FlgI